MNDLRRFYNKKPLEAVLIDGRPRLATGWEFLEDGPGWVLDLELRRDSDDRWFHTGETLEIVTPHETTVTGQVQACRTTSGTQRLVLRGHGSTYVETT